MVGDTFHVEKTCEQQILGKKNQTNPQPIYLKTTGFFTKGKELFHLFLLTEAHQLVKNPQVFSTQQPNFEKNYVKKTKGVELQKASYSLTINILPVSSWPPRSGGLWCVSYCSPI